MLIWLAQILPPVFIVFICIPFAFQVTAVLAAITHPLSCTTCTTPGIRLIAASP